MIKSITVTNYLGESLVVGLMEAEKTGLQITSIEGIGPTKATISMSSKATGDGADFNSARANQRNIIMNIRMVGSEDAEVVRNKTYKFFPTKTKVTMVFDTDLGIKYTEGYVESNNPLIFSKRAGTQISILCPSPYFKSLSKKITSFYGVEPLFEFPIENTSLTDATIEVGSMNTEAFKNVLYEGDAETGFVVKMEVNSNVGDFVMFNTRTRKEFKIYQSKLEAFTGNQLKAGDVVTISTVVGDKYINLFRDGEIHNILGCIDKNSEWFTLNKGVNEFAYDIEEDLNSLNIFFENDELFEGL